MAQKTKSAAAGKTSKTPVSPAATPADPNLNPASSAPETGDHPNPARAASDAAEAAAKAAAEAGKTASKTPTEKPAAEKEDSALTKLAKEYRKLYPGNKTFHITSDRQVFLDKDKGLADLHQRGLNDGKVTPITID